VFDGRSVEEFVTLRPDEVAMLVLAELQREPAWAQALNSWNYQREIQRQALLAGAPEDVAVQAGGIALEGWEWLRSNGFVAEHPQSGAGWERLTRAGRTAKPQAYLEEIRGLGILRGAVLDDELRGSVEPLMMRGKYDDALLAAMRLVEDRVRFAGHFSDSDIGVKLMRAAFKVGGQLYDSSIDPGEATARMDLFAEAIGVFKNPASHPIVGNDQSQATEVILLANGLLRILASAEQATRKPGRPRKR
jgi:uncharacterized protein (TIGR02391 family)